MSPVSSARYDLVLKRGALYNLLGGIGRLLQPLTLLSVTWLWGPAIMGQYLLGQSLMEIVSGGITAGYTDAATIFGSRHADHADDPEQRRALYLVFANAFAFACGLSSLVALCSFLLGRALIEHFFPSYHALLPGLYLLALALVPRALGLVAIAATKAKMRMEHDAVLNGFVNPACMLSGYVLTYALGGQLTALLFIHLAVEALVAVLAVRAFSRYFSLRELMATFGSFKLDRQLLQFAVPQSFNLTFNRYITRLDAIMLASFGLGQKELGYFGTAAFLTGNLGQIRVVFSGALAPVLARHHALRERQAFQDLLSRVARWTSSLIVPAVFICVVLREDILRLISAEYEHASLFVVILLIPPFTNCAYGMAGACLMFTGHTRVTLANSFCVAVINTILTYLLIPRYGMLGAALATAIATSITTGLQMLELWRLEQVRIPLAAVWKPHVGLGIGLIVLGLLWDPAALPLSGRLSTAFGLCAGYAVLMLALRHEDLSGLREPT